MANRLKQFPAQSNEQKFRAGAAMARALSGANRQGNNCVSPRCKSRKGEEAALKVNASTNLIPASSIADYQFNKQIGQGAYAVVKEATHRTTKRQVAIKVYDKFRLLDPQRKKSVNHEIQILKKLSHPHIVKLYDTIDTVKQLYLVLELVKGKSLYSYVKSREGRRLGETETRRIFRQIVSGIAYCHNRNVSHRDIKLENLLLDSHNDIKIIDFGFATSAPPGTKLRVFCGTPSYMAPEIVTKKEYSGPPADMWALGVLLFAMLSGKFPFKGANDKDLYKHIAKGDFSFLPIVPAKAKTLIKRLMSVDPLKRPTCEDVLADPFMADGTIPQASVASRPEISSKYNRDIINKIVKSGGYSEDRVLREIEQPTSGIFKLYYQYLHGKGEPESRQ